MTEREARLALDADIAALRPRYPGLVIGGPRRVPNLWSVLVRSDKRRHPTLVVIDDASMTKLGDFASMFEKQAATEALFDPSWKQE